MALPNPFSPIKTLPEPLKKVLQPPAQPSTPSAPTKTTTPSSSGGGSSPPAPGYTPATQEILGRLSPEGDIGQRILEQRAREQAQKTMQPEIREPGIKITETPSGEVITQVTLRPGQSSTLGWQKETPYTEYRINETDPWIKGQPPAELVQRGGYQTQEVTPVSFGGTITPAKKRIVEITTPTGEKRTGAFAGQDIMTQEQLQQDRMDKLLKEYQSMPSPARELRAGLVAFGSSFRIETWLESIKGVFQTGNIYDIRGRIPAVKSTLAWEAEMMGKPPGEKFIRFITPAYENVVIPFAGGVVFKGASSIVEGGKWLWRGKQLSQPVVSVLTKTYKAAQFVGAGAVVTGVGVQTGYTAATQPEKLPSELLKTGVQFAFFGIGTKTSLPKIKTSLTFYEKEGILTGQKYIDFGKVKLPVSRMYSMEVKPKGFTWTGEPIGEPLGLGSPWDIGSSIRQPGTTTGFWRNKVSFDTGAGWQPKTGIPEPGVYTPYQMIVRPTGKIIPVTSPGKITIHEPLLRFFSPTESQFKNLKFMAKGMEWQPKTGIDFPKSKQVVIEPVDLKDVFKVKEFTVKPPKDIVTKIDIKDGVVSVKKYGRSFIDAGKIKTSTGIPEPGVYTPYQMIVRPTTALMPRWYNLIGKQFIMTVDVSKLFGMKIVPKTKSKTRMYSFKDIVQPPKEQGTTVSSGGFGQQTEQILKTKTIQQIKPIQLQEQISLQEPKIISEQLQIQDTRFESLSDVFERTHPFQGVKELSVQQNRLKPVFKSVYGVVSKSLYDTKQDQRSISLQLPKVDRSFVSLSKTEYDTVSIQEYEQISLSMQEQAQVSMKNQFQRFESLYDTMSTQSSQYRTSYPGRPIVPRETTTRIPKIPQIFEFPFDEPMRSEKQQGYDTMVKDRVYVSGKKRYSERFIKINKKPLSKQDAYSLGASAVDNSAAATFKIKQANNKKAQPLDIIVSDWNMLQDQFYKKGKHYIERTEHRINTPGEIQQISARGWVAQQRKGVRGFGF